MNTIKTMNEAWNSVGKTLYIEGKLWGEITDVRAKAGVDIQWTIDAMRLVNVSEEKVFCGMFAVE